MMAGPTFVIEHLEKQMWRWCKIEYENSAELISPWKLIVSNVKRGKYDFGKNAEVRKESVIGMNLPWERVCVLDPKAKEELSAQDKNDFDYFIFGGILGDAEFNGRTGDELTARLPKQVSLRHIGAKQFSTDNAVLVTKMILDGKRLGGIDLQDGAEVKIKEGEDVLLPYCYPIVDGKPQMSKKLISYLKRKKGF